MIYSISGFGKNFTKNIIQLSISNIVLFDYWGSIDEFFNFFAKNANFDFISYFSCIIDLIKVLLIFSCNYSSSWKYSHFSSFLHSWTIHSMFFIFISLKIVQLLHRLFIAFIQDLYSFRYFNQKSFLFLTNLFIHSFMYLFNHLIFCI